MSSRTLDSIAAFIVLCFLSVCASAASVHKIGTDLYAYISDNDSSANSTFLVSGQGILVVDGGLNAQEGRKLLDEIRRISQAPVRWIVNTHHHPDHRGGNSVGARMLSSSAPIKLAWLFYVHSMNQMPNLDDNLRQSIN